jgi:hypothetical protein
MIVNNLYHYALLNNHQLKKAGGLRLRAGSHGYASTKRCVSLAQYQSHPFFSAQNDEQDTL